MIKGLLFTEYRRRHTRIKSMILLVGKPSFPTSKEFSHASSKERWINLSITKLSPSMCTSHKLIIMYVSFIVKEFSLLVQLHHEQRILAQLA